ncbi:MAG: helix-turn-helix transcriptional regulator [Thermotogota bacterium]|nr:helix-turn-helix transcriptional regulator [Thermotogota bacterium]
MTTKRMSLAELRKTRNLSLRDLGKELGMHWTTLGSYERGERTPNIRTADKIALFFNVPIEEIFPEYRRTSPYPKSISNCKV